MADEYKNLSIVSTNDLKNVYKLSSFSWPSYISKNTYNNFSETTYRNNSTDSIFVTCTAIGDNFRDRSTLVGTNPYNPPSTWNIYVYSDSKEIPTTLVSQGFSYYNDYINQSISNKCTVSFFVLPSNYYMIKSTLAYSYSATPKGNGYISSRSEPIEFNYG